MSAPPMDQGQYQQVSTWLLLLLCGDWFYTDMYNVQNRCVDAVECLLSVSYYRSRLNDKWTLHAHFMITLAPAEHDWWWFICNMSQGCIFVQKKAETVCQGMPAAPPSYDASMAASGAGGFAPPPPPGQVQTKCWVHPLIITKLI